jgi:hypothetical protein
MARCKLWVQSADWNTNLRADRIVGLRLWPGSPGAEPDDLCHLEAITADGIADPGRPGVRLCSASHGVLVESAQAALMRLIAEHAGDRYGGIINCCDEKMAVESGSEASDLFEFTPFREPPLDSFFGGKAAQPRR